MRRPLVERQSRSPHSPEQKESARSCGAGQRAWAPRGGSEPLKERTPPSGPPQAAQQTGSAEHSPPHEVRVGIAAQLPPAWPSLHRHTSEEKEWRTPSKGRRTNTRRQHSAKEGHHDACLPHGSFHPLSVYLSVCLCMCICVLPQRGGRLTKHERRPKVEEGSRRSHR